jgi:hypothetical protein
MAEYNAQDLSNLAWAFVTAGVRSEPLLSAIAARVRPRIDRFGAQGLCNVLWAFATAAVPAPELFAAIAAHAETRMAECNAQDLSNFAWALSMGLLLEAPPPPAPTSLASAHAPDAPPPATTTTLASTPALGPTIRCALCLTERYLQLQVRRACPEHSALRLCAALALTL